MKLSIITINYNNCEGLRKTIKSVVEQTWREFEYIVIDGGSTDGSVDIIRDNSDKISYWVSEPDRGIYHAMNKGIDVAKGEYCIFMNSGDVFFNDNVIHNIMPDLDGTDIICGDLIRDFDVNRKINRAPSQISMAYFYNHTLPHQATFIRCRIMKKFRYDESYKIVSDWKFFIETLVLNQCTYKRIYSIIANFDVQGISSTNIELMVKENQSVLTSMFPQLVLMDYEKFVVGISWEDKLYIDIKHSSFHKILYTINVLIIRIGSMFKRNSFWIKKYPIRFPKNQ